MSTPGVFGGSSGSNATAKTDVPSVTILKPPESHGSMNAFSNGNAPLHKLNERLEKSLARHGKESSNNLHPEGHASYKAACEEFYSPFPSCTMPRAGSNLSQLSRVSSTGLRNLSRVQSEDDLQSPKHGDRLGKGLQRSNSDPDLDEEADPRFKEVAHLLADMRCE